MTRTPPSCISTSNSPPGSPNRRHSLDWAFREKTHMNAPLRINEALLIADRAFQPFQCVAWHDGNGALSLSVIDRTNT
ncbi:MAG: hypothetical protein PHH99_18960, partial [Pseudomonas fluorescens]|nr:hypothetical protein [Pseudomonas fluorescens]